MLKFLKFNKHNTISLVGSLCLFLLLILAYKYVAFLEGFENSSVSFRFFMRDPSQKPKRLEEGVKFYIKNPKAHDDIIIIGLDEETVREFNSIGINLPFPREVYAKTIDFLSSGKPNSILMDIMFIDNKEGDEEVAKSMEKAGMVFLDYPFENEEIDKKYADIEDRMNILNQITFDIDPNDTQNEWVEEAVPPVYSFSKAAAGLGYANIRPDKDRINREIPLIIKFQSRYYPSIDLTILMHYYGITKNDVEIKIGKYIKFKNVDKAKMKKPNNEGIIRIPIDDNGFMKINYIGTHGAFPTMPFFYFHSDGEIGNDSIKDKIILVASYAVTGDAKDTFESPYGNMFGIEHHANTINTVLNQDFLYTLSENQNILIMLFISLFLGFLIPRLKIIFSIITTILFMLLYILLAHIVFDNFNYVMAFATPVLQIAATYTFIVALRLLTEQKEKRAIRSTFSKFVSKSVVDEMLQNPDMVKLGGEDKILTVLFSDIRGFTSISEVLSAQELVQHLNEYLQAMTDLVIKYNGTLDKYVGDEIMAFWGAPIPQDDHHLLACKCALEMMTVLKRLNANWEDIGKPPLYIGIGINTGGMVVGNMGSNSRMDYTLMGDNVNLGARLEGTNKVYKTNVIISEYTYEYVKDRVFVRELDLIRVKGKEKPVKIYELIDVTE